MDQSTKPRAIHVFACIDDPTVRPVALIEGFPVIFRDTSPMKVKAKAVAFYRKKIEEDRRLTDEERAELLEKIS